MVESEMLEMLDFNRRTPLIKLSPKKIWEGFLGASVATMVSAFLDNVPAARPNQEKSIITNTVDKNIAGSDQSEQNASPNPIPAEGDGLQDGENAMFERYVSPDKLYQVAWLKGRFADIIIKAREKTLDQKKLAFRLKLLVSVLRMQLQQKPNANVNMREKPNAKKYFG